jgi:peroxiredoxin
MKIVSNHLIFLIALLLIIYSQSSFAQKHHNKFSIEGKIQNVSNGTLVKLYDLNQQVYIDSAYINNGMFKLTGYVELPTTCWIQCMNEYAIIQVENTHMFFESPLKGMVAHYTASGGKEQDLQNQLNKLQRPFDQIYLGAYDSLINNKFNNDSSRQELINRFNNAQDTSQKIYIDFGIKHINSYLGLDATYRNRKTIPKEYLNNAYLGLTENYKNTPKAKALKAFLATTFAEKGKMMIDFDAKTIDGKSFKLSSLAGSYIYLAFGSAGCGPCRMENKELSKKYKFLSKNLAIVYFSLDKNINYWILATKEDSIIWNNISDMKGDVSSIKIMYGVQAIPTSFLIDKNGIIIDRFDGYDPLTIENIEKRIANENGVEH